MANFDAEFDVRCAATLGRPSLEQGRCQLFMGHDGAHAVVFASGGHRYIRSWFGHRTAECVDRSVGLEQRPWMRGLPVTAWIERVSTGAVLPSA